MPTAHLNLQTVKQLKKENLRYISDQTSGFFRQKVHPSSGRASKKFKYYDFAGKIIKGKPLERIKGLSIPPAWENVWICASPNGHIQATGIDKKKRKQYIYHPDWTRLSQQSKFEKIVDFGNNLPKIRQRVSFDLRGKTLDKKKVLATVVWLLENTFIRVGNEEYAKENESFGLTTLRNKHVKVRGTEITFQFKGKSGVYTSVELTNPVIAKTIKHCIELPGYELFAYIDDSGNRHVVDSEEVNLFLKEVTNDDFTAKDFRTWGATSLSAKNLFDLGFSPDLKLLKKNIIETVKKVSSHLNNTVSVCRNYYIHPKVFKTYEKNILIPHFQRYSKTKTKRPGLFWNEYALITLLQNN